MRGKGSSPAGGPDRPHRFTERGGRGRGFGRGRGSYGHYDSNLSHGQYDQGPPQGDAAPYSSYDNAGSNSYYQNNQGYGYSTGSNYDQGQGYGQYNQGALEVEILKNTSNIVREAKSTR